MEPKRQPGRRFEATRRSQCAARNLQIVLPLGQKRRILLAGISARESRGDNSDCNNQEDWGMCIPIDVCGRNSICTECDTPIAAESEMLAPTAHVRVPMTTGHFLAPHRSRHARSRLSLRSVARQMPFMDWMSVLSTTSLWPSCSCDERRHGHGVCSGRSTMKPACSWEYRYKFLLLVLTQPLIAFLGSRACGLEGGAWYAPTFEVTTGLIAIGVGIAGCLLRLQGVATLSARVMGSRTPDTEGLVTSGVFGATRNPLYLGTILLFSAYGLFFDWKIAVAFAVFHWVRYDRVVRYEERLLRADWGAPFEEYCQHVPRWLPQLSKLRFNRSAFSRHVLVANGLFVGLWLGILASTVTGSLVTLVPFELVGGILMAVHFYRAGRPRGASRRGTCVPLDPSATDTTTKKVA